MFLGYSIEHNQSSSSSSEKNEIEIDFDDDQSLDNNNDDLGADNSSTSHSSGQHEGDNKLEYLEL